MNILAMSPCAAKIWDYASPVMLLNIAIMLLSMLEILLLFYTILATPVRGGGGSKAPYLPMRVITIAPSAPTRAIILQMKALMS
jgi:hypothetical protein